MKWCNIKAMNILLKKISSKLYLKIIKNYKIINKIKIIIKNPVVWNLWAPVQTIHNLFNLNTPKHLTQRATVSTQNHFRQPCYKEIQHTAQHNLCLYLDRDRSFLLLHLSQQSWQQRGFPWTHVPYHSNKRPLRDTHINPEETERRAETRTDTNSKKEFKQHVDRGGIVSWRYKRVHSFIQISSFTSLLIEDFRQIL